MPKKISLKRRLLTPLAITLPVVMALTGALHYVSSASIINELTQSKGDVLVGFLQKASTVYFLNYDTGALERFVDNAKADPDVVFTTFYDQNGKELTKNSSEPKDKSDIDTFERDVSQQAGGTKLGTVRVGFRRNAIAVLIKRNLSSTLLGIFLSMLLVMFVVIRTTRNVVALVLQVVSQLSQTVSRLGQASSEISNSSSNLASSSHEQDVSVSKSVTALSQLETMIARTAENAQKSSNVATESRDGAIRGKEIVDGLVTAIATINQSHDQLSRQVKQGNEQLKEVSGIISRIAERTKVINEIVFQTKLLSFNASVEAARAGEHGKGFSVVAEEVGKLASMSGAAAKEITELLADSVTKVSTITHDAEQQMQALLGTAATNLAEGSAMVKRCHQAFSDITAKVLSATAMANEIARANAEQSTGVREIQGAMKELKRAMEQNAEISLQQTKMSENLTSESTHLHQVMGELSILVQGNAATTSASVTHLDRVSPSAYDKAA